MRYCELADAGDPVTVAWLHWHIDLRQKLTGMDGGYIILAEQLYLRSAGEKACYLCGHPATRLAGILWPPLGKNAVICEECHA